VEVLSKCDLHQNPSVTLQFRFKAVTHHTA
jgi:hypothetical protein